MMAEDLRDLDAACSRFRPDSELRRLERTGGGRPVVVSPLLFELFEVTMAVAVKTAGIVDPTVGSALIELGYDRDFDEIVADHRRVTDAAPEPAPGWWRVELDAGTPAPSPSRPASTSTSVPSPRPGPPTGPRTGSPPSSDVEPW